MLLIVMHYTGIDFQLLCSIHSTCGNDSCSRHL